ncbi:MAG: DNA-methyltransferase [Phycisphaerales bacterium]
MPQIVLADNLDYLHTMPDAAVRLIYIDPPFNTGKLQARTRINVVRDGVNGDRTGFHGARYRTVSRRRSGYADAFADYPAFLEPRLREAHRVLTVDGSLFVHMDSREVHYVKVLLDSIFGRASFRNEIIWAYDFGGRGHDRWPAKHDTILWYAKDPRRFVFRHADIDRIPYMAPRLVGPEKAARGKTPTDVWWQTIVPTNGREKTGYPTQKPVKILERIIRVHSDPGDTVLDFFAGSGTTGDAAARLGRECILVDNNPEAIRVMEKRLGVKAVAAERGGSGEVVEVKPAPRTRRRRSVRL